VQRGQLNDVVCNLTLRTSDDADDGCEFPHVDLLSVAKLYSTCPKMELMFNIMQEMCTAEDHALLCALLILQKSAVWSTSLETIVEKIVVWSTGESGVITRIEVKKKYAEDWMNNGYDGDVLKQLEWSISVGFVQGDEDCAKFPNVTGENIDERRCVSPEE
jgi:hypothetical protein